MDAFHISLVIATFLCSLVAGFLFGFAVVAMPGIRQLGDGAFIRAFQVMDGVIQNNQPLFILMWVGSVLALVAAAVLGFGRLDGTGRILIVAATVAYLFGVQAPTVAINIPLNNRLQAQRVDTMDPGALRAAREGFEPRWNRWNRFRTVVACGVSALLLVLLIRL